MTGQTIGTNATGTRRRRFPNNGLFKGIEEWKPVNQVVHVLQYYHCGQLQEVEPDGFADAIDETPANVRCLQWWFTCMNNMFRIVNG